MAMNLDDLTLIQSLDKSDFLGKIIGLADQLETGFRLGKQSAIRPHGEIWNILVAGSGAAVAGADCLLAYAEPLLTIPAVIWRESDLPAWAKGEHTLVVVLASSGESLDALRLVEQAGAVGCQTICMTVEGKVAAAARAMGAVAWIMPVDYTVRAGVALIFGQLYGLLERMGFLPEPGDDLTETLLAMREAQKPLQPEVVVARNPAKRLAGQMFGRWTMFFASDFLVPVARRWKNQLNQMAKSGGQFEFIPEADYNTLAGLDHPAAIQRSLFTIFLRGTQLRPRNLRRLDLTREICLQQGLNTDFVNARGKSRLAQLWTALLFADFTAYYLALANGVDPTPEEILDVMQDELDHLDG
jgi:glucose/mannose-6-phosphate isomerase